MLQKYILLQQINILRMNDASVCSIHAVFLLVKNPIIVRLMEHGKRKSYQWDTRENFQRFRYREKEATKLFSYDSFLFFPCLHMNTEYLN